jgi:hypothetical protein
MNEVKVTEEAARMAVRLARFEAFGEAIAIAERFISPPDDGSDLKAEIASETAHHIAAELTDLRIAAKPRAVEREHPRVDIHASADWYVAEGHGGWYRALGPSAATPAEALAKARGAGVQRDEDYGIAVRTLEYEAGIREQEVATLRGALEWFADEGHYTDTYRRGAGYVDAVGITHARAGLLGMSADDADAVEKAWLRRERATPVVIDGECQQDCDAAGVPCPKRSPGGNDHGLAGTAEGVVAPEVREPAPGQSSGPEAGPARHPFERGQVVEILTGKRAGQRHPVLDVYLAYQDGERAGVSIRDEDTELFYGLDEVREVVWTAEEIAHVKEVAEEIGRDLGLDWAADSVSKAPESQEKKT